MSGDAELSKIAEQVATQTGFPYSAVSIVDRSALWLAVAYGFNPREFARPGSFCDAAIGVRNYAPPVRHRCLARTALHVRSHSVRDERACRFRRTLVTSDGLRWYIMPAGLETASDHANGLEQLISLASEATAVIEGEPNALAHAQHQLAAPERGRAISWAKRDAACVSHGERRERVAAERRR